MTKRNSRLGAILGSLVLVATGVAGPVSPAAAATDKLPDLRMARLTNIHLETTSTGRRLLRFDSVVVNVGVGPFEARGARAATSDPTMDVAQRVFDTGGGYRDVTVPGTANGGTEMYFAGDGHTHWHLRDLETYALTRLDNGARVGTGAKHGFCFYDNVKFRTTLPGAPSTAQYPGCGSAGNLSVTMGLSVGWGDLYRSTLPDQYIDITGLKAGRYRLRATADEKNWFQEQDNSNNFTWTDLQIKGNSVSVITDGPAA